VFSYIAEKLLLANWEKSATSVTKVMNMNNAFEAQKSVSADAEMERAITRTNN